MPPVCRYNPIYTHLRELWFNGLYILKHTKSIPHLFRIIFSIPSNFKGQGVQPGAQTLTKVRKATIILVATGISILSHKTASYLWASCLCESGRLNGIANTHTPIVFHIHHSISRPKELRRRYPVHKSTDIFLRPSRVSSAMLTEYIFLTFAQSLQSFDLNLWVFAHDCTS